MVKVTITYNSPMSKEEFENLLHESARQLLVSKRVKFDFIPHMVKISQLIKSTSDTLSVEE